MADEHKLKQFKFLLMAGHSEQVAEGVLTSYLQARSDYKNDSEFWAHVSSLNHGIMTTLVTKATAYLAYRLAPVLRH